MSPYPILVLVGSLRRDSYNRKLANALAKLAPPEFSLRQAQIGDLPLYNQDDDADQAASVRRLKDEIIAAKGVLFVTPEYNRSVPGVLKNAIDNASRPYGANAFAGKPAGVIGVSVAATGTAWRSSICATSSPISTRRRSANPKPSSRRRRACSTRTAKSAPPAGSSRRPGWTAMPPG